MTYDLINPFNGTSAISCYTWNQELIVLFLGIIAFCQLFSLLNMLGSWAGKK